MELKQLEVFVSVVKNKSFSRAADKIFLSQSTISTNISSLEKELNTQLLERTTRQVTLTKTGETFFAYALDILALRDQALEAVKSFGAEDEGEISIIASSVPAQYLLPAAIGEFCKKYPKVIFNVNQSDSAQVEEKLSGGHFDFGITGTRIAKNRYDAEAFYTDTLVMISPVSLGYKEEYTVSEIQDLLSGAKLVMREKGSGTRAELEKMLSQCGIKPTRASAYFGDTQSIINAVSQGMGISFVSQVAAQVFAENGLINSSKILDGDFSRELFLLTRREMILSPAQRLFAGHLKRFFDKEAER